MSHTAEIQDLLRRMTLDELHLALTLVRSELDHREGRQKFTPPGYLRMKAKGYPA